MIAPILVDRPTLMPFKCASCGSQTDGPFTCWNVNVPPMGMLYSCARCIREDSIRRGFLEGERAEELRVVDDLLSDSEHTISIATKQIEQVTAERDAWKARWEEDTAEMQSRGDRILQLEKRLRRDAVADLALVTGQPLDAA